MVRGRETARPFGLFFVVALLAGCGGGGGGGSSLESQLSKKSKLEITDCKKEPSDSLLSLPNTQAYTCKYKDTVSGERKGYLAYVDADGNAVSGAPSPFG